jgi:hypothetical protein
MPSRAELAEFFDTKLPLGELKRYDFCPFCNKPVSREGFIVWRTDFGWRVYCHRCGTAKAFRQDGVASPSALISRVNGIRSVANASGRGVYLPEDFELCLPTSAKTWLRKYGVTDEEIKRFRFGYSARMNRLVLPVFKDDQLVYWQGRLLGGIGPKYLSMKSKDGGKFFELVHNKEVVLVEDIISAICVRRAGFSAIALLGSYVGAKAAARLKELNVERVVVWLDPDKRSSAVKFAKQLSGLGFKATCLVTPAKDPKDYNVSQIKVHLAKGGLSNEDVCSN